jgi:hypothetical protein
VSVEKGQCEISIHGIDVPSAVVIIARHVKLCIMLCEKPIDGFVEWRTV